MKELDVFLRVKIKAILDDPEATEQTIRFLVEEDLRDKGWDADVEMLKGTIVEHYEHKI